MRWLTAKAALIATVLCGACGFVGLPADNIRGCVHPEQAAGAAREPAFVLVALGDFGDGTTGRNVEVAEALRAYLDSEGMAPDAVILLGDNFYPNGLIGSRTACVPLRREAPDRAIGAQLEAVLEPFSFLRDRSVTFAIPGNHDHRCRGLGSLANQEIIDRWLPPEHRWHDRWRLFRGRPRALVDTPALQLVALDSMPMIEDAETLAASTDLLGKLLDDERDRWRLVAAHHPLYGNGHHDGAWFSGTFAKLLYYPSHLLLFPPLLYGNHGNYEWGYRRYRRQLETVFQKRRVHVFLGGHEHALEVLRPSRPGQPVTVISGAAARCAKIMERDNTVAGAAKNGFAVIFVERDALTIELIGTTGCDRRVACARPASPGDWQHLARVRIDRQGAIVGSHAGCAVRKLTSSAATP